MARLALITNTSGNVLGTLRTDPVHMDGHTLRFRPVEKEGLKYHELEVEDELLNSTAEELHRDLEARLRRPPTNPDLGR